MSLLFVIRLPREGLALFLALVISAEKEIRCPDGSTLIDGKCYFTVDHVGTCPVGTAPFRDRCADMVPVVKRCPEGYQQSGPLCFITETTDILSECPSGFTPVENDMCRIEIRGVPECPEGYEDIGDRCAKYGERIKTCPDGFPEVRGVCVVEEREEMEKTCVNGGDPADNCKTTIPVDLTPTCPRGKMVNHECRIPKILQPDFSCPDGYEPVGHRGGRCHKTITYDCSEEEHEVVCDDTPEYSKPESNLRALGPKPKKNNPLPVCHKIARTVPKQCEKTLTAQAAPYCTEGNLKANRCLAHDIVAPTMSCGAEDDADVFVTKTGPYTAVCLPGFSRSGHVCSRFVTAYHIYFCPIDTPNDECAVYTEKSCQGPDGDCVSIHLEPAKQYCPDGWTRGKLINQGKCQEIELEFRELVSELTGVGLRCARFEDKIYEHHDREVEKRLLCPIGYNCIWLPRKRINPCRANMPC